MPKSTTQLPVGKPYPEFPLFPHQNGRWAKKVRGKLIYFGKLADDPKGEKALALWQENEKALLAGSLTNVAIRKSPVQRSKRKRPHPDFPLFPHASGYWAKKVRGKLIYFGQIAKDPKGEAAIKLWLDQKDDLLAGRTPRLHQDTSFTIEDLCDHFLNAQRPRVISGELAKRSFDEYFATCERMVKSFGMTRPVDDLRPTDFDIYREKVAETWGPVRLGNEVQRVRSVFKYGFEAGHIDRPIRFGPLFRKPSARTMRKHKQAQGERMFEARHIRRLLKAAGVQLRAMILLGINAGFGNTDCGTLPFTALDLKAGWVDFPRPKTGIERRCPLWPETVEALKTAIAKRPEPRNSDHAGLVFITKKRSNWTTDGDRPITKETAKLLKELGLHRDRLNFYALRHTFRTIADETRDFPAIDLIMGHSDPSMAARYRERISDERLKAVAEHVRRWLWRGAGGLPRNRKAK